MVIDIKKLHLWLNALGESASESCDSEESESKSPDLVSTSSETQSPQIDAEKSDSVIDPDVKSINNGLKKAGSTSAKFSEWKND